MNLFFLNSVWYLLFLYKITYLLTLLCFPFLFTSHDSLQGFLYFKVKRLFAFLIFTQRYCKYIVNNLKEVASVLIGYCELNIKLSMLILKQGERAI